MAARAASVRARPRRSTRLELSPAAAVQSKLAQSGVSSLACRDAHEAQGCQRGQVFNCGAHCVCPRVSGSWQVANPTSSPGSGAAMSYPHEDFSKNGLSYSQARMEPETRCPAVASPNPLDRSSRDSAIDLVAQDKTCLLREQVQALRCTSTGRRTRFLARSKCSPRA